MQFLKFKDIKHKFPKQSWMYQRNEINDGEFEEEDIIYIEGDYQTHNLDLDEYFTIEKSYMAILVEGNVSAKNIFNDNVDGATSLIVLGNLEVNNIVVGGQDIYVTGNLTVHECFWGDYNHGQLTVDGSTNAYIFVATQEYRYDHVAERAILNYFLLDDDNNDEEQFEGEKINRFFLSQLLRNNPGWGDEILSWEEWLHRGKILAALKEGKPILKSKEEILAAQPAEPIIPQLFTYNTIINTEQLEAETDNFIKLFDVANLHNEVLLQYTRNDWNITYNKQNIDEKEWLITMVNQRTFFSYAILLVKKESSFSKELDYVLEAGFCDEQDIIGTIFSENSNTTYNEIFVTLWHDILKDAELGAYYYRAFHKTFNVQKAYSWFSLPIVTEPEAESLYPYYETSDGWRGFWKNNFMFFFRQKNEAAEKRAVLQMAMEISGDEFDSRSYRFCFNESNKPAVVSLEYNSSQEGKYNDRYQSVEGTFVFAFDWEKYKEAIHWYSKAEDLIIAANQTYLYEKENAEGDDNDGDIENDDENEEEDSTVRTRQFIKPYETVVVDAVRFKVIDIHEAHEIIKDLTDFEGNQLYDVYNNTMMFPLYEGKPFFLLAEQDVSAEQFSLVFSTDECPDIFILGFIFLKNLTTVKYVEGHDIDVSPVMIVLGKLQTENLMVLGNTHYIGNAVDCGIIWGFYNHGSLYVKGDAEANIIYADDMEMHFEKLTGVAVAVSDLHGEKIFTTARLPQKDGTFITHEYLVTNTHKLSDIVARRYIDLSKYGEERISYDGTGNAYEAMLKGESIIDWDKKDRVLYKDFQNHFEEQLNEVFALPDFKERDYIEWKNESGWQHYFVNNFTHEGITYTQVVRNFNWGNTITARITFAEGTKDYHLDLIHYDKDNTVKLYWNSTITDNSIQARAVKCAMLELFGVFLSKDDNNESGTNVNAQPENNQANLSFYEIAVDAIVVSQKIKLEIKVLLKQAFENPQSFYNEHDEFILSERGLTYDEHSQLTAKFVFIDKMIEANQMAEVDWKEEETEVRFCISKIVSAKQYNISIATENKYNGQLPANEILELINEKELKPEGYCSTLLDIDSDSYVFTIVPLNKQKETESIFERMK